MTTTLFLGAHLLLALLGGAAAFHPQARALHLPARLGLGFLTGGLLLALEATAFSALGIPWGRWRLGLPLFLLALALGIWWRRLPARPAAGAAGPSRRAAFAAAGLAALGLLHFFLSLATTRATSIDFLYHWGVKAVWFAQARAIDGGLLGWEFFAHGVPDYPPLVPIVQAWGVIWSGRMPWNGALLASGLWLVASVPLVHAFLACRLAPSVAAAVTAFWTAALSVSLAHSYSGGNAEAPLLAFATLAAVALLVEPRADRPGRLLPALALAGAAFTKVEGLVAAAALAVGTLARDLHEGRSRPFAGVVPLVAAPVAAIGLWFLFQRQAGLPVGFGSRQAILGHSGLLGLRWENLPAIAAASLGHLTAGNWGLSWLLPLTLLAVALARRHPIAPLLPGLAHLAALFGVTALDYLGYPEPPVELIGWTLPRISQPALSVLILTAAVAQGKRAPET